MSRAHYDDIAVWYDNYLKENPIYQEMVLPMLLELAGNVQGQSICDLACGQGWLTREFARCGAHMTGIDLSEGLLSLARRYEMQEKLGILYQQGDVQAIDLQIPARHFDGCMCILALMDIADPSAVFTNIRRLLKTGGWLVLAITHPCFEAPGAQWITFDGGTPARAVSNYTEERFWKSEKGGVRSRVGAYHRMLSTYINSLIASDFMLDQIREPAASGRRATEVVGSQHIPSLLFLRAHLK
ncbi:MAG TPA: class I SAM-dependent methyltransferase [Ktedonobacteraceae bacterium]|nr:class I SAM-dependent methyltransferase [Ktedonobacteraceae bacterium]